MSEEVEELERLIKEDNVGELSKILNTTEYLQSNFDTFLTSREPQVMPLLHLAVKTNSQKVLEYLLSQDFVEKRIGNKMGENIYHIVCSIRGADQLFSIIEKNVPHHLLLDYSHYEINAFYIACKKNNIFIVKRVYEILVSLLAVLPVTMCNDTIYYASKNKDIEVLKYVTSLDGMIFDDSILFEIINSSKIDIVVHLLNVYLCQSIPSHLHNQFHIFQLVNQLSNHNNNNNNNINNIMSNNYEVNKNEVNSNYNNKLQKSDLINQNEKEMREEFFATKTQKRDRDINANDTFTIHIKKRKTALNNHSNENNHNDNDDNDDGDDGDGDDNYYFELFEENFKKKRNRICQEVCKNVNLDVVQFIFSLKGIQTEINDNGYNGDEFNVFLIACLHNSNIKVIKYIHKLFPSLLYTQTIYRSSIQNAACFVLYNNNLEGSEKLNILHFLYLNGIDIHFLSYKNRRIKSIYSRISDEDDDDDVVVIDFDEDIVKYLKVISQDFDYINNEHDDKAYRKPSLWKEIHHNNNNNNNNIADEQLKRIYEWKNRFDEHVIHHLSKMIQEHMRDLLE